jgi:hypothetical protein
MKTQLEFPAVPSQTPEQQVAEILRRARARYGRNLKPFFDELLSKQPKHSEDEYSDLIALAKHRRQSD